MAPPAEPSAAIATRDRPMSVTDLVRAAGGAVERGVGLVWVEGETTQVSRPSSGHIYFTLRDRNAVMPAVLWRDAAERLRFRVDAGMTLRVRGRLGIYDRDGKLQLYVDFAEPAGLGAAALALEQLRQRLAAEGLFAAERKRPLPRLPRRIGVVTSQSGAAVRDIVKTVQRRFPVHIVIADCQVQGASAPIQIANALRLICRARVDVVILGRGGGSATDLSAFNDERVVRAVAGCPVPVISAVGHESDLTLCDLVADQRASTPTGAGELAVPVLGDLAAALRKEENRLRRELELVLRSARQEIDRLDERAHRRVEKQISTRRALLAGLAHRLEAQHPRARMHHQRATLGALEHRLEVQHPRAALLRRRATLFDLERRLAAQHPGATVAAARIRTRELERRAAAALARGLERSGAELASLAARLDAMSPLRVLDRGYAVATAGGHVLTSADAVAPGDVVEVRLARGQIRARVE